MQSGHFWLRRLRVCSSCSTSQVRCELLATRPLWRTHTTRMTVVDHIRNPNMGHAHEMVEAFAKDQKENNSGQSSAVYRATKKGTKSKSALGIRSWHSRGSPLSGRCFLLEVQAAVRCTEQHLAISTRRQTYFARSFHLCTSKGFSTPLPPRPCLIPWNVHGGLDGLALLLRSAPEDLQVLPSKRSGIWPSMMAC